MSDSFFQYLKAVNPIDDDEATVGYQHRLNVLEKGAQMVYRWPVDDIDKAIADTILALDIEKVSANLSQVVPAWNYRSTRQQEILTDYQLFLGNVEKTYPKFYEAVLTRNIKEQREHYKMYYRDSDGREREHFDRNKLFYSRYLSPVAVKGWDRL